MFVLKDLLRGLPVDEVEKDLTDILSVTKVMPLTKRYVDYDEDKFPYFVIHLHKIKMVLNFRVRFEKLNTKNRTTQCHRYQQFGHGSEYCAYSPRCVKWIGDHLTDDCRRIDNGTDSAQCLNCNGVHPANFRNCPALQTYKDKIEQSKSTTI